MKPLVGLGADRLPLPANASAEQHLARRRAMLFRALNLGTTVAVVGAGCSAPLGYPTWSGFVLEVLDHTLLALRSAGKAEAITDVARLEALRARLTGTRAPDPDQLMFAIGVCQRTLERSGIEPNPYHRYLEERFRPQDLGVPHDANPYCALAGLPIKRFVTFNYECALEQALAVVRGLPLSAFGVRDWPRGPGDKQEPPLSFTQQDDFHRLAIFPLAKVEATANMVFHCHGRYDDVSSIVASEADYQRWYLADEDGAGHAFRQTIDLVFGSNPILFVGYGLGDDDLLRPLRLMSAVEPARKEARPLFALMPVSGEPEERDRADYLFERYGLSVVPYRKPDDPQAWGSHLCRELSHLKEGWREWREGWLQKPVLRKVEVVARPPRTYRHYAIQPHEDDILGRSRMAAEVENLKARVAEGPGVVVLAGRGGTGKSWRVLRLLDEIERDRTGFEGIFFWSSYYADDWVTGLDRALAYLEKQPDPGGRRRGRMTRALASGRHLVVFDGLERLLREGKMPTVGHPLNRHVHQLLEDFTKPTSHSTVIITTRLWPDVLGSEEDAGALNGRIRRFRFSRLTTEDLAESRLFAALMRSGLSRQDLSALCALLDGHVYGLLLAAKALLASSEGAAKALSTLRRALADTPPDRRVSRMLSETIDAVNELSGRFGRPFLERLALFMSPVTPATLDTCYESVRDAFKGREAPTQEALVRLLLETALLFKATSGRTERDPAGVTVHPTVRSYLFQRSRHLELDALPNFTLPGLTSGTAAVHPGSDEEAALLADVFDRLHTTAETAAAEGRDEEARELCRSAFGVLRSRMEAITAARWCRYDEYIRFGLRQVNLAKKLAPSGWDYLEREQARELESPAGPLYPDELAWLYNDIGLCLCVEGDMPDTFSVWEQGYAINRVLATEEDGAAHIVQSRLHMAHSYIELGNLNVAEQYLKETERSNAQLGDPDYALRIQGYRGLLAHLRGHLEAADASYRAAIRGLRKAGWNLRAHSIFLRHRADLKIKMHDLDAAEKALQSSRSLAEQGDHPDLVAFARMAQGHLYRARGGYQDAQREYAAALHTARQRGIRRLEADIQSELSRLALDVGDAEAARQRAMESLMIANVLSLGLRQTHGLVVLGLATLRAGRRELGVAYLEHAKRLAHKQGYFLRATEAEAALHGLVAGGARTRPAPPRGPAPA